MVSIERASKSEQTLLKHYSLKINRYRDTEGKKIVKPGSRLTFSLAMITKNILLPTVAHNCNGNSRKKHC